MISLLTIGNHCRTIVRYIRSTMAVIDWNILECLWLNDDVPLQPILAIFSRARCRHGSRIITNV